MFDKVLERLRNAAKDYPPQESMVDKNRRVVLVQDLRELLHHFDRLESESRKIHPANMRELLGAATKSIDELTDAKKHLEFAISLVEKIESKTLYENEEHRANISARR